ncbi:hypothetical protein GCM10010330_79050 [Streptomyces tendae]|uniref:hypothetical protein n=1 Tax=Streptomyces tendae TaxID=1932 RepID=UPI00199E5950|nr:hypothetical protein [Streptomyces tendae]GHB13345.1 hypothetical protein GCM10010330_79050 [Streptomyces tendae]
MSKLPENTTTAAHGDYLRVVGPHTRLPRVLDFFELDGYSDPSAAWQAFTRTWNWAAPLATAVPAEGPGARPAAWPEQGGFALSGQWHLPPGADAGPWLVLPLTGTRRLAGRHGADDTADLFVVGSQVLLRQPRVPRTGRDTGGAGPTRRLDGLRVPEGFATHSAGTPLGTDDAAFVWTAVAGLAFGAARRLTDALAGLAPSSALSAAARTQGGPPVTVSPADAAAELAGLLRDERLSLAARVHGAPLAVRADAPRAAEALADQVRRTSRLVHHVIAAAYEHALPLTVDGARDPLVRLVEESSPILHCMRFAVELLPPRGQSSTTEG